MKPNKKTENLEKQANRKTNKNTLYEKRKPNWD